MLDYLSLTIASLISQFHNFNFCRIPYFYIIIRIYIYSHYDDTSLAYGLQKARLKY